MQMYDKNSDLRYSWLQMLSDTIPLELEGAKLLLYKVAA